MTTEAVVPPPEPLHADGADFGAIDADLGDELVEDGPAELELGRDVAL